ncbi:MAG: 4Fe-4S binding protein [Candidatus Lokiarchaeota archaeon]|nr:4Fe-4S binding protein [Candidatus Lokiarchaeota archaeon]
MSETEKSSCCNSNTTKQILNLINIKITINQSKCIGCGLCADICPFGLPKINLNNKYEIYKPELCIQCSACERNCPEQAILLVEEKGCGCLWDARQRASNKRKNTDKKCCC